MKTILRNVLALLLGLSLLGCQHLSNTPPAGPFLLIGAAEIDITPPVGHRMAGYFDERLATGVHDPLKAKAIVMQQGGRQIALVFCDLVGVSLNVTTNARSQASQKTGIPYAHIVISATHSHTGPLFDDVRRHYFHEAAIAKQGSDPQERIHYPEFLTERLVQVIGRAQSTLRPADLHAGIARQEDLTFNRRFWMKNGKVAFNPGQLNTNIVRPDGPTDPDVGILLARDRKTGQPFAGATVFAMHSDTVGGTQYSADYAYYLEQTLRQAFGEEFISAFGAGTCGDLNHINVQKKEPVKGIEVAERLGTT
jgi:neutral ceramidase